MDQEVDALRILQARRCGASFDTAVPTHEIAALVATGIVVVVKQAFDPAQLRSVRSAIEKSGLPDAGDEIAPGSGKSFRIRREDRPDAGIRGTFDTYYFDVTSSADEIGREVRASFEVLADYWRALTGLDYDFAHSEGGPALQPWAMHYPAGGGWLDWHVHPPGRTQIGLVLGLSHLGVDFQYGGTEIRTPFGIVDTAAAHDIGDICLFRYDLPHRVSPVDPQAQWQWDGTGRWSFILPLK